MTNTIAHPFDAAASGYDADFTERRLGRWLREAVWAQLADRFQPSDRILELGCGTGEDALWLAQRGVHVHATDASPAMLDVARQKAAAAGVTDRVTLSPLNLTAPTTTLPIAQTTFDGAFSNFGALNCVEDLATVAHMLSKSVRSGGRVVLVVMGPFCPWEWAWYAVHGQFRTAFRRFRKGAGAHVGDGQTVRVWYPTPRHLRHAFAPYFEHEQTVSIGALLPPSYLAHLVSRSPRIFTTLAKLDAKLGRYFPFNWLNDHYLITLKRR